jgi:hypothetical protein
MCIVPRCCGPGLPFAVGKAVKSGGSLRARLIFSDGLL